MRYLHYYRREAGSLLYSSGLQDYTSLINISNNEPC